MGHRAWSKTRRARRWQTTEGFVSVVRGLLRRKHRDNYGRWRERRDEKKQRAEGTRQRTEGKEDCGLRIEKRHGAWGKTAGRRQRAVLLIRELRLFNIFLFKLIK